jgi:hypothetical protein
VASSYNSRALVHLRHAMLRYGIVEGMDMRDSRTHNYPPRWNAAPSQDLLVIRRNRRSAAKLLIKDVAWRI